MLPHNKRRMFVAIIFASTSCMIALYVRGTSILMRQIIENIDNQRKIEHFSYAQPPSSSYNIIVNNSPPSSTIVVHSQNTSNLVVPSNPRIYFIHVGKAGGTTIVKALRLKEIAGVSSGSHGFLFKDKRNISYWHKNRSSSDVSQLTHHILGYFHVKGGGRKHRLGRTWLLSNTNMFLFNVRLPIGRLTSAWNFHRQCPHRHGLKCGWGQDPICRICFPHKDLNAMVEALENGTIDEECSMIGVDALLGRISSCGDNFELNYDHYWKYAIGQRPDHTVAVVRMEHMWDDIIQLDELLGGTGNFGTVQGMKITHRRSEKKAVFDTGSSSTLLSDANTIFLCCLIAQDIEVYQQLILKAWNLHANQKRDSLTDLLKQCLIKPSENDVLEHPFSWKGFHLGDTCQKSLGWLVSPQVELATFEFEDSTLPLLYNMSAPKLSAFVLTVN